MTGRVILIGGSSRAARAIRERLGDRECVGVTRDASRRDSIDVNVLDYHDVPRALDLADAVLVNCVGSPRGNRDELFAINAAVPLAWALAGREQGARAFIQLSSFSVYGLGGEITSATPLEPATAYGESKLAGEKGLRDLRTDRFAVDLVRIPILIGAGGDKLTQLIKFVRRSGLVPRPPAPVPRPMLSYSGLASVVAQSIEGARNCAFVATDPEPFDYPLLREEAVKAGQHVRSVPISAMALGLLRRASPALFRSMFQPIPVAPEVNLAGSALPFERTREVVSRLFRGG